MDIYANRTLSIYILQIKIYNYCIDFNLLFCILLTILFV